MTLRPPWPFMAPKLAEPPREPGTVHVCRDNDAACAEVPVVRRCEACPLWGKSEEAQRAAG